MMGPTHAVIGTATGLGFCALIEPSQAAGAVIVGASFASSKMPDQLEVFGLRHRGPTHWLLTGAVVVTLLAFVAAMFRDTAPFADEVWLGLSIGYFMHIAADMCTVSGVPALGPFDREDHWLLPRPLRVHTGKLGDGFFALLATVASVGFVFLLVPPAA